MERLTKKISKAVQNKYSLGSYLYYDFANADDTNKLLNKLGAFEDFMEEQGFESLKELKEKVDFRKRIDTAPIEKAFREKQEIQDKWQKLKEWVENNSNVTDEDYSLIYGFVLDQMEELEKE